MHPDLDLLGLLALGETVGTESERQHTETCPACAGELAELRRLVDLGRSVSPETTLATPGHHVWDAIRDALGLARTLEPPERRSASGSLDGDGSAAVPADAAPPSADAGTQQFALDRIDAALASLSGDPDDEVVAHARLLPVPDAWSDASGTAELATDGRGRRLLEVVLDVDPPETGVRAAWLVHRDDPGRRQSLGMLDGRHGLWTVPHSIDLAEFPYLHITQEDDDRPDLSGSTVLRGELALAS